MRKAKIIGIIVILIIGGLTSFIYLSFYQEPLRKEFLSCDGYPHNVILIIPETLSARHMAIYGYERDTMPFVEKFFSQEALIFENAWSTSPWTVPSFASLFTSQLSRDVFLETYGDKLSDEIPNFIDTIQINGIPKFASHFWNLLPLPNVDMNLITNFKPEERFQSRFQPERSFDKEDHLVFLKASEWLKAQIQKNHGQPFFLLIQPSAPKAPYNPPEPYRYFFDAPSEYLGPVLPEEIFNTEVALQQEEDVKMEIDRFRLQYDQEISYLDSEFESFINQIPEEVLCNTVFIFTSDHGEAFGQHGQLDHGRTLYEEEIHVPLLVRVPGINSKKIQQPVTLLDIGPTILDVFGLKIPDKFQGTSLLPLFRGEELHLEDRIVRAEHIFQRPVPLFEWSEIEPRVRSGPLPVERIMELRQTMIVRRISAVRKEKWKLLLNREYRVGDVFLTPELYNLERDYKEQDNLLLRWHDLSQEEQIEVLPLFKALADNNRDISFTPDELYSPEWDYKVQDDLVISWRDLFKDLSKKEQAEIISLFEKMCRNPGFVIEHICP